MKQTSRNTKPRVKPQYFTGKVILKEAVKTTTKPLTRIFNVKFYAGARTKLHAHTGAQILIGTLGHGSLVTYKKSDTSSKYGKITRLKTIQLGPGKVAYVPPKCLHTHGSISKSQLFAHVAVNTPSASREMLTSWFDSDLSTWSTKLD